MVEFKPFTKETLDDAKSVVRQVFGEGACSILEKAVRNPALREVPGSDAGEVLYSEGVPVGFNAALLHRLYYGQSPFWGMVGSTIGLLPEARKDMIAFDLMSKIVKSRFGSELFFGNSANKKGMRVNKAFGMKANGPVSCGLMHVAVIRPVLFALYMIRTKLLKRKGDGTKSVVRNVYPMAAIGGYSIRRLQCFDVRLFDAFWKCYLSGNKGLVSSRSTAELNWMFGDEVSNGKGVLIGAFKGEKLVGYVVFANGGKGRCWKLVDMIAAENSEEIVDALLKGSLKILRRCSDAVYARVSGFPDSVQPTIAKAFPMCRELDTLKFSWKFQEGATHVLSDEEMKSASSWFFGPYDGDECMSA